MRGMGSGVPVGAPPTVRTGIKPNLRTSPIRTRHGCSYNQYPALGFNARNRDLVLPEGAPPTVRTAIKPNLKASPHSHPGRVLLQSISGVEVQYPGKGSGFTCRSTAHGANRNRTKPQSQPHSHPTRVLLQSVSGVEVQYPGMGSGVPVGA